MSEKKMGTDKSLLMSEYKSAMSGGELNQEAALAISSYVSLLEAQFRAALKTVAQNDLLSEYQDALNSTKSLSPTLH